MRAPRFWGPEGGLAATLLTPLGWLYGAGTSLRLAAGSPWRAPVPVVCVGNAVAGGAGKTPVALDIASRLATAGHAPHLLTRGYGGSHAGPLRVDAKRQTYNDVGDEALLLAASAATWVARDRAAGAKAAIADGAACLIMDDGFQNPGLAKDLSLLVVDGGYGFGNGRLIPAGPLREPTTAALARAQAVVLLGEDQGGIEDIAGSSGVPVLHASVVPGADAAEITGRRVVAFAGIGRPAKFFETLKAAGVEVLRRHAYSDHYPYAAEEIDTILAEADGLDALAVTTAKDHVRLPQAYRDRVRVLTIGIEWEDEAALDALLAQPFG